MRHKYISFLIDSNTWILKNPALWGGIQLAGKLYEDYFSFHTK